MSKKKIILQTNNPILKTGLAENGRLLMKYLLSKKDKYDLVYYMSQTNVGDPILGMMPCKSYGCIPNDPQIIQQLNNDPGRARNVAYGSYYIDEVIKNEKPDILWESDDIWSTPFNDYFEKPWSKMINIILHKTIDSRPILEDAFRQAKNTKNYFTWAKFAELEMKKFSNDYSHVRTIYGAFDTSIFHPISKQEKLDLRKKFNIDLNTMIFFYLSRNQLRKFFPQCIEAFAAFKKEYPHANAKIHFHTSFSEKGQGWDIPKLMNYYRIRKEDVLCTYVCKNCGQWHVASYEGEDINCKYCKAEKSMITPNIVHGVSDHEMSYLYGLSDASPNGFTSGGLERGQASAMLCGLPTAATNYSCGEDYCILPFVHRLNFHTYYEPGTNFIKASTDINSIKNFMAFIYKMSEKEKQGIGEKSREWAAKTFSIETIGRQWEEIFDNIKPINWSSISLEPKAKNPSYPMPQVESDDEFIDLLYKNILYMDEPINGQGHLHWFNRLKNGIKREEVYSYFIKVANEENNKNQRIDFWDLIDKTDKKRFLLVIRESIGDIYMITSLFESFKNKNPDVDLYVATNPQFFEVLEGNPYIHKVIPYIPQMDAEMLMIGINQKQGYFDGYCNIALGTQKILNYLSNNNIDIKVE